MINFYGKKVFVNHKGVQEERRVTLSATYENQDDGSTIAKIAMAACSLKDKFLRRAGRGIAQKRLLNNNLIAEVQLPTEKLGKSFNTWCAQYCDQIQEFGPTAKIYDSLLENQKELV
jgi:hypothetical protein